LTDLGFRHRIALAPNAAAAWILSGHQDGLAVTTPEIMHRALAMVPLRRARLPNNAAVALNKIGVRDLGKLWSLPRAALAKRYGPELLTHLDRLQGQLTEVLPLYRPPDVFDARIEFNYEVSSSQALLFPLRRLITDLATYLSGRDGGVQRFVVRLEHEDHADSDVVIGLLTSERDAGVLFDLARGRLEQVRVPAPVRGMRLLARELPPFVPAAGELFDGRAQQAMPWTQLRERLRARLGNTSVYNLTTVADHRPERAWRRVQDAAVKPGRICEPQRPTWLLPRPIPLRDARPRLLAGPERIESGWWDGGDAQRDYYVIETSAGQRAWAFCPAGEVGPFMLHGWFA
jgi:protein ImuB